MKMGKVMEKRMCVHCGCTETPLWRSGPDGQKTLCNADGVRLKKGKLQLYLDAQGNVTAKPGPGNKLYNTVAKRKEIRRPSIRKPPAKAATLKSSARVRKPVPRSHNTNSSNDTNDENLEQLVVGDTVDGRRPFTRGASRKNEALLNKVLAESKSLYEASVNGSRKKGDPAPVSAISSVMKEVYGCLPSNESQLSLHTDDSYSITGSLFDFNDVELYPGEPGVLVEDEESVKAWDLNAELNETLSPLVPSLTDGNGEPLAVNDAS